MKQAMLCDQATWRGRSPRTAALFSMRRTSSVCRVMPLFEKIERRCARAVLREPHWPLQAAKVLGGTVEWPGQYERA